MVVGDDVGRVVVGDEVGRKVLGEADGMMLGDKVETIVVLRE